MPFISFAQNLEDVVLHRALMGITHGFYVDVGANSPNEQSVTRAFYERGWHGINIEPALGFHEELIAARPHDINLAVAAGDRIGTVTFYDIPGSELSTGDADLARQHHFSGLSSFPGYPRSSDTSRWTRWTTSSKPTRYRSSIS
jgi:hypothetical protein